MTQEAPTEKYPFAVYCNKTTEIFLVRLGLNGIDVIVITKDIMINLKLWPGAYLLLDYNYI